MADRNLLSVHWESGQEWWECEAGMKVIPGLQGAGIGRAFNEFKTT